jgi:hypothetical protein
MSLPNRNDPSRIPAISEQELRRAVREGIAELTSAGGAHACCAKVVWNNPWQLKYCDPFGDGECIRVNLVARTNAGALEEAEAIWEQRHPGIEWVIC